jgi:hypothetical protein
MAAEITPITMAGGTCPGERDAGVVPTTSLLIGPPGAGKSMLARRLTTMLPAMTLDEAMETTRLHRVAGRTGDRTALVTTRPCRAPHHPISDGGRIGGGHVPMPGAVSLAHHGMLLLDARLECRRTSWRYCATRRRRMLWNTPLPRVLDLHTFGSLAMRDSGRARSQLATPRTWGVVAALQCPS